MLFNIKNFQRTSKKLIMRFKGFKKYITVQMLSHGKEQFLWNHPNELGNVQISYS